MLQQQRRGSSSATPASGGASAKAVRQRLRRGGALSTGRIAMERLRSRVRKSRHERDVLRFAISRDPSTSRGKGKLPEYL
ncbi:hypothetical protein Scep_015152 [Stephania cephalantha]|uniref:Uncharacterized protein n=1 Tax=Stephania cephalantha TaxID=152367 RepID=A0AAP0J2H9_9MAGN